MGSSGTATWMPRIVRGSIVVLATMATSPDALKMAALTGINSFEDLKAKRSARSAVARRTLLAVMAAKKLNVPDAAFDVIPMTPPNSSLHSIAATSRRTSSRSLGHREGRLEVSGKSKVHIMANSGDVGYLLTFVVVANKKFVTPSRRPLTRVLAALRDAINFQNGNPARPRASGRKKNKLKPDIDIIHHQSLPVLAGNDA